MEEVVTEEGRIWNNWVDKIYERGRAEERKNLIGAVRSWKIISAQEFGGGWNAALDRVLEHLSDPSRKEKRINQGINDRQGTYWRDVAGADPSEGERARESAAIRPGSPDYGLGKGSGHAREAGIQEETECCEKCFRVDESTRFAGSPQWKCHNKDCSGCHKPRTEIPEPDCPNCKRIPCVGWKMCRSRQDPRTEVSEEKEFVCPKGKDCLYYPLKCIEYYHHHAEEGHG